MFIYVKKLYKIIAFSFVFGILFVVFIYVKRVYSQADFGKEFEIKAELAEKKLNSLHSKFELCSKLSNCDINFLQSLVFPEVMRYNSLKDGIEAESLRTLYVQFGEEYANFSIGLFQMKPTFAEQVETKSKNLLPDAVYKELQLEYKTSTTEQTREQRVQRLQDEDWQLVYLTAFVNICDKIYEHKSFSSATEKLQWYATVYNAGFDKADSYISNKTEQDNYYLSKNLPGKKFKYAAIAGWYYNKKEIEPIANAELLKTK
jgi:hypothetical protein